MTGASGGAGDQEKSWSITGDLPKFLKTVLRLVPAQLGDKFFLSHHLVDVMKISTALTLGGTSR
jgi:hypothetical protein